MSILNFFQKKPKKFTTPSIFLKTLNLKNLKKDAIFLKSSFYFKSLDFVSIFDNKAIIEFFLFKNDLLTSWNSSYLLKNIKKKNTHASRIAILFCKLAPLTTYMFEILKFWNFYNFFFLNNFIFNTIAQKTTFFFFKNKKPKTFFYFFKKKNKNEKAVFFLLKKKKNTIKISFLNYIFKNTKSRFFLKNFRNVNDLAFLLLSFVTKNIFNPKAQWQSYYNKCQTAAFQLTVSESLSSKLLKISKMSPKINKFVFFKSIAKPSTRSNISSLLGKFIHSYNLTNQLDNFFFNRSYGSNFTLNSLVKKKKKQIFNQLSLTSKLFNLTKWHDQTYVYSTLNTLNNKIIYFLKKKTHNFTNFLSTPNKNSSFKYNLLFKKFNYSSLFYVIHKSFFFKIMAHNFLIYFFKNIFTFGNFLLKKQFENFFLKKENSFLKTNIIPSDQFFHVFKKKILKIFRYDKFSLFTAPFYINSLIRFLENTTGKSIIFKTNIHLNRLLTYYEKTQCFNWSLKVKVFRKMLGPRLFLAESLEILYLAFKIKDVYFLSNWLLGMMKKISFWKYRLFFRYLKYVLRYFFVPIFKELNVKGIKFQLKGKISVAGNARTRTLLQKTGVTGHATFNNKIVNELVLVPSFTGVMGLKVWIFF